MVTSPLFRARLLLLGAVVAGFPLATAAVFVLDLPRADVADALAVVYSFGLFLAFTTSFWFPGPARLQSMSLLFIRVSVATHLSWELVWLLFWPTIAASRDKAWAYVWWAYIDGGDSRYAAPSSTLLVIEALSVCNGLLGLAGLRLWAAQRRREACALFMVMATVHLNNTAIYFACELLEGLPNVNTASPLDLYVKFGLANAPWIVFPWGVLAWGWSEVTASSSSNRSSRRSREESASAEVGLGERKKRR